MLRNSKLENIYSDPIMRIIPDPAGSGATTLSYRYITVHTYGIYLKINTLSTILSRKRNIFYLPNTLVGT
jgi:hypothetical protein